MTQRRGPRHEHVMIEVPMTQRTRPERDGRARDEGTPADNGASTGPPQVPARTERQSDHLLGASVRDRGRGEYPFYSQRWIEQLGEREGPGVEELPAEDADVEDDARARLAGLVVDAGLSERQRYVMRWIARGLSQRQAAEQMGISEAQVCRLKQTALEHMRRAARGDGSDG